MHTRHLPQSIGRQLAMLHFAHHRRADYAFARGQPAARIAPETLELSALGDVAGVDRTLHGGTEAVDPATAGRVFAVQIKATSPHQRRRRHPFPNPPRRASRGEVTPCSPAKSSAPLPSTRNSESAPWAPSTAPSTPAAAAGSPSRWSRPAWR